MADWVEGIVSESARQYLLNWRLMASATSSGAVFDSPKLSYSIAATGVPLFNMAMLRGSAAPLGEGADLATQAIAEFRRFNVPGILTAPESWLKGNVRSEIESAGMSYLFSLMGMRTARLNDPERPSRAEVHELTPEEATEPLARINGLAYGMEETEWSQLRLPGFWRSGPRAYAVLEHGQPVAVGAAATAERISYLMWMATLPHARQKGYAEAIIRRAWEDAQALDGAKFTVLHATKMGRPVYARLGYVAVAEFPTFVWNGG